MGWTFNDKICVKSCIKCCVYYDTVEVYEIDINNMLDAGLKPDKFISVSNKGIAKLKVKPCPFLEKNACKIHTNYGFRYKPLVCQFYPYHAKIENGKVKVSLLNICPAVEEGNNDKLDWIKKVYLDNYSENPTMYMLLYRHYLTHGAFVDFSTYFWNNFDVTKDSMIVFLGYLLTFSKENKKILNKKYMKKYLNKDEIQTYLDSVKYSKRFKIAKEIIDIYSNIIIKIINIKHPEMILNSHNKNKKQMNDFLLDKLTTISVADLFSAYVNILPDMYAIENINNSVNNESLAIKIFETHRRFSSFGKKRIVYLLNNYLQFMLFFLCYKKS